MNSTMRGFICLHLWYLLFLELYLDFWVGIFGAEKDTKTLGMTTIVGAISNIVLNIVLLKIIGTIGAAIATLLSVFIVWLIRIMRVKKYIKCNLIMNKDILSYLILIIQVCMMNMLSTSYKLYLIEIILLFLILGIYYRNIKRILANLSLKRRCI